MFNKETYFSNLSTEFLGRPLLFFDEVSSTNDVIKELQNLKNGTVVVAARQIKGRGRDGRVWFSENTENLYFSFIIKFVDIRSLSVLNIIAAYSLCDCLKKYANFKIKWPNDILLNGKKIAGILIETKIKKNFLNYAVIGIGLNVDSNGFPNNLKDKATSLKDIVNEPVPREEVLANFFNIFENYLLTINDKSTTINIVQLWQEYSAFINKKIILRTKDDFKEFIEKGINASGAIIVEDILKNTFILHYGEIINVNDC
jgi:BirA family biotin operon repressor/biotin-[acetyl-CoA-carboxylase] ligase